MKKRKLLASVANSPESVRFDDLLSLAIWIGFELERVSGSHHILIHRQVGIVLNLQPRNGQAKPYQVRQFLKLVEEFRLVAKEEQE